MSSRRVNLHDGIRLELDGHCGTHDLSGMKRCQDASVQTQGMSMGAEVQLRGILLFDF